VTLVAIDFAARGWDFQNTPMVHFESFMNSFKLDLKTMNLVTHRWLTASIWALISVYLSLPANAQANPDTQSSNSTLTKWQMVWLGDLGLSKLKLPHEGLATHRQDFIRTVYIQTEMIDGELVTTRASANCNSPSRITRKVVAKPAQGLVTYRNGRLIQEVVPATYKTVVEYAMTSVGCSVGYEIDGKTYEMAWPNALEAFMLEKMQSATHHDRNGNTLEWSDDKGDVIARFEKHLDITSE